ncbi:MAG: ABC transporter permease [Firmicutes bacterium]|nr:ABC transporter permease [Bacillota bacterium]
MPRFFYQKLALNNLKKNSQTYRAYLLTCIGTICMYFIMHAISVNEALNQMSGGTELKVLLFFGVIVIAIFSTIFLLYTNSFLIKRRKKEFGLFNILGMEKRHLAKIMFWETLFIALLGLTVGIISGMILSKLMFLVLLKLIAFNVPLAFEIPFSSISTSVALFGGIFALSLFYNLGQIQLAKPIELLRSEQMGEREPKTKWLLILIGAISLGAGYYIALITESPLQAFSRFFLAVLLVMVGTYSLFTAGSVGILKLLRSNKEFYYQPRHFTAISGLLFRMKQNAVGLANICILSTAVLVTLSTTFALYVGVEDQLRNRFPRSIEIKVYDVENVDVGTIRSQAFSILEQHDLQPQESVDFRDLTITVAQEGDSFLVGREYFSDFSPNVGFLSFLNLADYQRIVNKPLSLEEDEIILCSDNSYPYETLTVLERTFTVKDHSAPFTGHLDSFNNYSVIVKDLEILEELRQAQAKVYGESASSFTHYLGFELDSSPKQELEIYEEMRASIGAPPISIKSRAAERDSFYMLYGGLFFIGIFLGTLFVMGTVLIIYYKQITEGYDDQKRFAIMQQVGMGQEEVKKTIRSQVLMVFFLPLVTAGIHILFAFKMITRLLMVFNLTNVQLFAWCCLGTFVVFALFYGLVYSLTARVYYKIVSV